MMMTDHFDEVGGHGLSTIAVVEKEIFPNRVRFYFMPRAVSARGHGPASIVIARDHRDRDAQSFCAQKLFRRFFSFERVQGIAEPEHFPRRIVGEQRGEMFGDFFVAPDRQKVSDRAMRDRVAPMKVCKNERSKFFQVQRAPSVDPNSRR